MREYKIVATFDSLTSNIWQEMDLKHFHVDEFSAGMTAHSNCRSCINPYFDDEFTKDDEIHRVPSDMNYKEWKKSMQA